MEVDVLVIQEFKSGGIVMLNQIVSLLDPTKTGQWVWDFSPTNIPGYVPKVNSIRNEKFGQPARVLAVSATLENKYDEGYAVILKKDLWLPFDGSDKDCLSCAGLIGLCNKANGVVCASSQKEPPFEICSNPPDVTQTNVNFVQKDLVKVANAFSYIEKNKKELTGEAKNVEAAKLVTNLNARRPCKIKIKAVNQIIDLLVYHGIANIERFSASELNYVDENNCAVNGANLATLLEEVHTSKNVILAGDFNIIDDAKIKTAFKLLPSGYTQQTKKTQTSYYGTRVSVVKGQYEQKNPLDLMCTKFSATGKIAPQTQQSVVMPVPTILENQKTQQALVSDIIKAVEFQEVVSKVLKNWENDADYKDFSKIITTAGNLPQSSGGEYYAVNLLKNLQANKFTPKPLYTALFYLMFISDHLPLMISLDVGGKQ